MISPRTGAYESGPEHFKPRSPAERFNLFLCKTLVSDDEFTRERIARDELLFPVDDPGIPVNDVEVWIEDVSC